MCCKEFADVLGADEKHFSNKRHVSVTENQRTFKIAARSATDTHCLIKVDGGLLPLAETKKCDYLILRCLDKNLFFIELKGSDVVHGINQIAQTATIIKNKLGVNSDYTLKSGHVVSGGQPKAQTAINKARQDFYKKHKFDVLVHTNRHEL